MLTDALVLKTWPYSESSLIVSLLTADEGVVRALAKGARRIKGGTSAAFDLFALVRGSIRVRSGDGLSNLGSVEVKREWLYLRRDLTRLALASVAAEVLGSVASTSPHDGYFLNEAIEYLDRLEAAGAPGSLTGALLIRLLHHAGYPPRLDETLAGTPLPRRMEYDFGEGVLRAAQAPAGGAGRRMELPRELIERIAPALGAPPPLDGKFVLPARLGPALLRWLARVWEDHLHHPIRSMDFLERSVFEAAGERGGES